MLAPELARGPAVAVVAGWRLAAAPVHVERQFAHAMRLEPKLDRNAATYELGNPEQEVIAAGVDVAVGGFVDIAPQ